jgi:hypothetical protein
LNWPKTAIVHEWFSSYAGSERVVESFTNIWPDADVFTLADLMTEEERKIHLLSRNFLLQKQSTDGTCLSSLLQLRDLIFQIMI